MSLTNTIQNIVLEIGKSGKLNEICLPADNLIKYKKKHSEKQHLVNSRYELLKTRQQFCGDISTLFQSHCQTKINYLQAYIV